MELLIFALLGLGVLWIVEIILVRRAYERVKMLDVHADIFINTFTEIRSVVNENANILRVVTLGMDDHDTKLITLTTLYQIMSEKLLLDPKLYEKLTKSSGLDKQVAAVVDLDEGR